MAQTITLDTSGPHSPEYTQQVARGFAECVRVLNYATRQSGLQYPGDVYDVLAEMKTGTYGLRQLFRQLSEFLEAGLAAGRLRAGAGDPARAVADTRAALDRAAGVGAALYAHLNEAHSAIAVLGATGPLYGED